MRQELLTSHKIWRSEAASRLWLSMLIAAMEEAAQPEIRRQSIADTTLDQLRAQLAFPASLRPYQTSELRH